MAAGPEVEGSASLASPSHQSSLDHIIEVGDDHHPLKCKNDIVVLMIAG